MDSAIFDDPPPQFIKYFEETFVFQSAFSGRLENETFLTTQRLVFIHEILDSVCPILSRNRVTVGRSCAHTETKLPFHLHR